MEEPGNSWKKIGVFGLVGAVGASAFDLGYFFVLRCVPGFDRLPFLHFAFRLHVLPWFLSVVCAPFFEEILLRGLVFRALRLSRSFFVSMVISAVVFAFLHPVVEVIPVFVLGLVLAWVYERTGYCLAAPMLIHVLYNAMEGSVFPIWLR